MASKSKIGTASIFEGGTAGPLQVLLNVTGGNISTHVGHVVNGIILVPTEQANLDGKFNGYVIAGGTTLGLLSGAIVNSVPVPEPGSVAMAGLGVSALVWFRRRNHGRY